MTAMTRVTLLTGVLAAALTAASWAQAPGSGMQHGKPPAGQTGRGAGQGMGMHGPGPMGALSRLNLTEDQTQQIHKLMADTQPERQADMEQMQKLHDQLRSQVFADNGPTGDSSATAQEIGTAMNHMIQAHLQMAEKISAILTPAQRKQLREMPMSDMMGMMMMGGMGGAPMRHPPAKK